MTVSTLKKIYPIILDKVLAFFLLSVSYLKFRNLSDYSASTFSMLSSPAVQTLAIIIECILGILLLVKYSRAFTWTLSILLFAFFAVINIQQVLVGQVSCNCFGSIKTSPQFSLAVDFFVLVLLFLGFPKRNVFSEFVSKKQFMEILKILFFIFVIIACLLIYSYSRFSSIREAVAHLKGEQISIENYLDFGHLASGSEAEKELVITNWTSHDVRVIGGTSDCSCITTKRMPITIPARGTSKIIISLAAPKNQTGNFTRKAIIFTDCENNRAIQFHLGCQVE